MRTLKGQYYDEHLLDLNGGNDTATGCTGDSPRDLDSTRVVEQNTAGNIPEERGSNDTVLDEKNTQNCYEFPQSVVNVDTSIVKEIHFDLSPTDNMEPYLGNLYELYDIQPETNFIFFNKIDQAVGVEETVNGTEESRIAGMVNSTQNTADHREEEVEVNETLSENRNEETGLVGIIKSTKKSIAHQEEEVKIKAISEKLQRKDRECDVLMKQLFDKSAIKDIDR